MTEPTIGEMDSLIAAIKDRVTTLLAGATYDNPAGGEPVPARIYFGAIPAKRTRDDQGQDFPFVVIRPLGGTGGREAEQVNIRLICGAYTAADDADPGAPPEEVGALVAQDLAWRLIQIKRRRGGFKPWQLTLPVEWKAGDGDDGNQPHPYYLINIDLVFKAPPQADIQ